MIELFVAVWIICAIPTYGLWVAYFQREWPDLAQDDWLTDRLIGAITSLIGGPIGLIIIPLYTGFRRGWML